MPNANARQAISARVIESLTNARLQRGLSKNRLAEMTGLSLSMVSYVERGMRHPTLDTLLRLADALEVDLGAIIREASASVRSGPDSPLSP